MISTLDSQVSLWQNLDPFEAPKLETNISADVCIIGSGISGLTAAYLLADENISVVVIDAGEIGGRQTLRTTAHLSNAFDDRYCHMQSIVGEHGLKLLAESHTAAIEKIEHISRKENIACDFRYVDGYLFLGENRTVDFLLAEQEAATLAGIKGLDYFPKIPIEKLELGPCLRFPKQAQFHPGRYIIGLANVLHAKDVKMYRQTRAVEITSKSQTVVRTADGHKIICGNVIVATNVPFNTRLKFHTKQAAYRSYVLGFAIPKGFLHDVLLWDTCDPYHYIRKQNLVDSDILIVGGEDHKTGQQHKKEPFFELEQWARKRFPFVQQIHYSWSGQIIEPADGVAYIGRLEGSNIFVVTGDSGQGMTHGTIAGILITDLIQNRKNIWERLYSPDRLPLNLEIVKENINAAIQYSAWIKPEKKLVCPHFGGILRWNETEKTWDCPVHGSRFCERGSMVNGPAITDITKQADS